MHVLLSNLLIKRIRVKAFANHISACLSRAAAITHNTLADSDTNITYGLAFVLSCLSEYLVCFLRNLLIGVRRGFLPYVRMPLPFYMAKTRLPWLCIDPICHTPHLLEVCMEHERSRIQRPPAAQRRRPRRGVSSQARRHLPLPPLGGRW
jgi:hypothetical protein